MNHLPHRTRFWSLGLGVVPVLLLAVVFAVHLSQPTRGLEGFWVLPSFQMTAVTSGPGAPRMMTNTDLLQHPWVADFIFTRCEGPCPGVTSKMAQLQGILPQEVRLVSFTVDPEHDTDHDLQAYAKKFGAVPNRWVFLRGDKPSLHALMKEGFHFPLIENADAAPGFRVTHSTHFVLVDAHGVVRGFYTSTDNDVLPRIARDVQQLLKEHA